MDFIVSATTDIGLVKKTNQDGLSVKVMKTQQGKMAFAILCDGMGGLAKGEVASTTVIQAFNDWVCNKLPLLTTAPLSEEVIKKQWTEIILNQNDKIKAYGKEQGIRLGTTIVVMLFTQTKYYILNVGDSRAYEVSDALHQLTVDQSFVAREVQMGRMTPEQAKNDPRRSVLLQCIGASDTVCPDIFSADVKKDAVYMLCSDGFIHEITPDEIYQKFHPNLLYSADVMENNARELIALNKARAERDNISVLLVRTY